MKLIVAVYCKEGNHVNTFAAKRDCRRIYRLLANATTVEIKKPIW